MLNYNRIREHFQECEIERLQKRVVQLEEELEASRGNQPGDSGAIAQPQAQAEQAPAGKIAAPSDAAQK